MSFITRKTQPKFTRKPHNYNPNLHQQLQQPSSQLSGGKGLRISRNVFNMVVGVSQKAKEDELMELLFTEEKSSQEQKYPNYEQSIQKSAFSKNIFLEYSPDSVFATPFAHQNSHEESMLIESEQKTMGKTQESANSIRRKIDQRTAWLEKSTQQSNISFFNLAERSNSGGSITVALMSTDNPSFRVTYSFHSEARKVCSEEKDMFKGQGERILKRVGKQLKKQPLLLFKFYSEVIADYQSIKLRQFLMQSRVKYSTEEILDLEKDMNKILDMCKGQQIVQILFMSYGQEEMININLGNCEVEDRINIFQCNFWRCFAGVVLGRRNAILDFQVGKIQQFLYKLL